MWIPNSPLGKVFLSTSRVFPKICLGEKGGMVGEEVKN
jgi:hypothetical protein